MSYRAESFMRPEAASDRTELGLLGWLGEDSPHVLAVVDPIDDAPGIEVRQHPDMMLAADPELHRVVDEWFTGARRKVRIGDSNWRTVALMTLRAAHGRERAREFERIRSKGGET